MELPIAVAALAWALVAYIIYFSLNLILTSRRHARMARELKCEEPPFQHNKYPGGIDNIMRALAADKEKQFPVDSRSMRNDKFPMPDCFRISHS